MKKNYTKPEIEMVEYKANDVIMTASGVAASLDNDVQWLSSWTVNANSGSLNSLLK